MKTQMSRFQIHDDLSAPEEPVSLLRSAMAGPGQLPLLGKLVVEHHGPPTHFVEEAREAGWTDEQLLEAIAFVSLESFTAMVNVTGDVPVDGSVEESRTLRAA